MAEHREQNLDDDGSESSFQKTVVLRDWWLVKCQKEFQSKRFGVSGFEDSDETRAMRVFTSSPIIKALDVFTLVAADGIYITLRGFINKERLVKNGFSPEIFREFIFGFPPRWEQICYSCFEGGASLGTDTNTVPSTIAKASYPILSPCKNNKKNLEGSPAEERGESSVPDTNTKDGSRAKDKKTARRISRYLQTKSGGKSAEDERILESSKVHNATIKDGSEGLDKAKSGDVENDECNAIDDGVISPVDGCGKRHSCTDGVEKLKCTSTARDSLTSEQRKGELNDESEAMNSEDNALKLDEIKLQNMATNDGDHVREGLDKAKSNEERKDEYKATENEVIERADECGRKRTSADNIDKVTSTSATGESLTSEQQKGELKVTTSSPHSLVKDLEKSRKPGKKRKLKKSHKTLKNDGNVVEPSNCSETKVKSAENRKKPQNPTTNDRDHGKEGLNNAMSNDVEKDECVRINDEVISPVDGCSKRRRSGADGFEKLPSKNATKESLTSEQQKGRVKETKTSRHSLSKDLDNSSKPGKKGKSKKSEETIKRDWHAAEENVSGESEENVSWGKTKRKIDFELEVTPDNKVKKQKTNAVTTDPLGQKRSRSGRLLVSPLEFWRNQIPIYDTARNLIEVKDGHETNTTPSKGKGSHSRKRKPATGK